MPTLPRPGKQSLFDMVEQNKATAAQAQTDNEAISSTQHEDQYTTSQKQLDPEISSIFTQSTIDTGNPIHQSTSSSSSSRFGFLRRNKSSSSNPQDQAGLLANSAGGEGVKEKEKEKEKKKSRFENPFKPHEQTDEDRAIMEKLAKRLGSKEEAIRQGGAQPAGYRGVGGGYAAGGPWTGGM
ncbi:hypothetical protein D6D24_08222 [Aureobasidium pullulans]|uniref:Uncharacterized protein n=1 Tax=Aureobasidium pullulans TaxID=5580 RepID=A0A4S8VEI6_AURPU|nr:hypothetical protein D6D24_08222 [Aureobasidium pullulans]